MIFNPELGSILLVSTSGSLLSWALLGVGIFFGFVFTFQYKTATYLSLAINMYVTARDFKIPYDIILITAVPITILQWTNHLSIHLIFFFTTIVLYFVSEDVDVPKNDWFPAIFAANYLSYLPSRQKYFGLALIILRHYNPKKIYLLYGCILFLKPLTFDKKEMTSLLREIIYTLFGFILCTEEWFFIFYSVFVWVVRIYKRFK